ncbi:MAG TPA: peptidylprolyl isomerase, partial [Gemmatimonadaceae bacterium]|nr:peptidylprolyl isomerase [Gemmatimonadaceae bacterium]
SFFALANVPPNRMNVAVTAELWVSYQLLAHAAALNDSLGNDLKLVYASMWDELETARIENGLYPTIAKSFGGPDTSNLSAKYARGEFLAAQHILFTVPAGAAKPVVDSIKALAESVRLRAAAGANFSALARQYTQEPGGKETGGSLGVFPRGPAPGSMVPAFEAAVQALQPGQVAPVVVKTEFGYHVIRRHLLSEVRSEFVSNLVPTDEPKKRDAYLARLRVQSGLRFVPGSAPKIRDLVQNHTPAEMKGDTTVIATWNGGSFTLGRLAAWLETLKKTSTIPDRLAHGADTAVIRTVTPFVETELLDAEAAKAGIRSDSAALHTALSGFVTMLNTAWQDLRIDPQSLTEAHKVTPEEREAFASNRVDEMLTKTLSTGGQNFVEIPPALANALRTRYPWRINYSALTTSSELATKMRMALDSMRARKR